MLTSIDSIVVDPTDPMTVYAGAWPSFSYYAVGVYKTRDGGFQWVNSTAGVANVSALAINPRDSTILYAGSDDSILKSEDAGTSWSAVNTSGSVFALAVDPTVPSIVYAGCALLGFPSSSGVLRTRDSGASWSFFPIPGYTFGSMVVDPLSRAVFAATDGGVLRSDDEGEHWAAFGQGLTGLPVSSLALGSQRTLYAGTQDGVFVVSLLSRVGRDSLPRRVSPR